MSDTFVRAQDAPRFFRDGVAVTGYASPSRGCRSLSVWRFRLEPGAASPLHELTSDEAFVAIRGRAAVVLGGREFPFLEGDGLSVPPATPFQIRNNHDEPFEAIACMTAGGQARVASGEPFSPPWTV